MWRKIAYVCAVLLCAVSAGITIIHLSVESRTISFLEAHEVREGRPYELLEEVSKRFGLRTPRLYIAKKYFFNAAHITSSTSPLHLRRGKIVISQEQIDYFDEDTLRGIIAHEIVHLLDDPLINPWYTSEKSLPDEIETDHRAAAYVGYATLYATLRSFERMTELSWWHEHKHHFPNDPSGTWMGEKAFREFRNEVRERLKALDTASNRQS